jgi:lipopolysaccharide transport system permease protein
MVESVQEILIRPGQSVRHYWRDLWLYRELLWFLSWRDVMVRYKQTAIGVAWALIRPFLTMLVFTVVFSLVARLPSEGSAPYAIMVFTGLLPWFFFASALSQIASSLIENERMITKIYFPRMVIPLSAVLVALFDFLLAGVLLIGLFLWFGFYPDWRMIALPLFTAMGLTAALGPGLMMAALNVRYRDFRYVVPFLVQIGLYLSPVGYSSSLVPETWRLAYSLNPMVGVIDGFRWSLLAGEFSFYWPGFFASQAVNVLLLVGGVLYFRRTERFFTDVI